MNATNIPLSILGIGIFLIIACSEKDDLSRNSVKDGEANIQILSESNVKWEQLNPARGDQSPQAGTLWGNRKASDSSKTEYHPGCPICEWEQREGPAPTGFLAKFVDGFSSPPHIHNVTYRAVVINGLVHNDDPDAAPMWMPAGSFWTQPKGEVHITSAKGDDVVALVEIDKGPYLVLPPEKAFDSGERPINIDPSNIVWVDAPSTSGSHHGVKIAYLWGDLENGKSNGTFLKLPLGFKGNLHSQGKTFRGVVITGQLEHQDSNSETLMPGSYFGSSGTSVHQISCKSDEECIVYIRTNGEYMVKDAKK